MTVKEQKKKKKTLNFRSSLFEFKTIVAIGVIDKLVICLTFMTLFLRKVTLY